MIIDREHVIFEQKLVGSVAGIDHLGMIRKVDDLFEAMKRDRTGLKADLGEGKTSVGVASLVVDQSISGRVFGSVYQTIAFAGFPMIHVAIGGRYYVTSAEITGPPCDTPERPCPPQQRPDLHAQVDEERWRLLIAKETGTITASSESTRTTPEGLRRAALLLMHGVDVGGIILHIAPDVPFARFAPFLAELVDLGLKAAPACDVTLAMYEIDSVSVSAR